MAILIGWTPVLRAQTRDLLKNVRQSKVAVPVAQQNLSKTSSDFGAGKEKPTKKKSQAPQAFGTWDFITSVPATGPGSPPSYHHSTAYLNGKLYLLGGLIGSTILETVTNRASAYDEATGTWSARAPMPGPAFDAIAVPIQQLGKIVVVGGGGVTGIPQDSVQIYTPATNTWAISNNGMPQPRQLHAGGVYKDSLIYCLGGYDYTSNGPTNTVQIYDAVQDQWLAVPASSNLPVPLWFHTASVSGNSILVVGGRNRGQDTTYENAYLGTINPNNPALISWTRVEDYPGGKLVIGSAAPVQNSRKAVIVTGGLNADLDPLGSTYLFDIENQTWRYLTDMNIARCYAGSLLASKGDKVWAVCATVTISIATLQPTVEELTVNTDLPPDPELSKLIVPSSLPAPKGSVTRVILRNTGNTPTVGSVQVRQIVRNNAGAIVRDLTVPVPSLPIGPTETREVAFTPYSSATTGNFSVEAQVLYAADQDTTNNVGVKNFSINPVSATLPYVESFPTSANFPTGWARENLVGDADSRSWQMDAAGILPDHTVPPDFHPIILYRTPNAIPSDDWLFTQGLPLQSGLTYRFSFWYRARSSFYAEKLEVKLCGNQSVADSISGQTFFRNENIVNTTWQQATGTFTVGATGDFSLGFHCYSANSISPPLGFGLAFDDVRVEQLVTNNLAVQTVTTTPTLITKATTVSSSVRNTGLNAQTAAQYDLSITNSASVVVFTDSKSTGTLAPNANGTLTFAAFTPTVAGTYTATVTKTVGDEITTDNTLSRTQIVIDTVGLETPYVQNFETSPNPNFPAGFTEEDVNGITSWLVANNPVDDHTVPDGARHPEYRAGGGRADDWFFTPGYRLEAAKSYKLTFFYKMQPFADFPEAMEVKLMLNARANAPAPDPAIFDNTNIRNQTYVEYARIFKPLSNGIYSLGFHAKSAGDFGNIYVDDIRFEEVPPNDIGVNAVTLPAGIKAGQAVPVTMTFRNFLTTPQTLFGVGYRVNGGATVDSTYSLTLGNGATSPNFTFGGAKAWTPSQVGRNTLTAYTALTEDANRSNDSVSIGAYVFPANAVLVKDFNDLSNSTNFGTGWTLGTGTGGAQWSVVTTSTNLTATLSPNSGTKMAKFNAFDAANNGAQRLITPTINASALSGNLKVEFWMSHDERFAPGSGFGPDSLRIFYSINNGSTYTRIPNPTDPNDPNNLARNDGSSPTPRWKFHSFVLPGTAAQAQVRIAFEGFSQFGTDFFLDDIQVIPTAGNDVAALRFGTFPAIVTPGTAVTIPLVIKNNGAAPVTDVPVQLLFGGTALRDTIRTNVGGGAEATVSFTFTPALQGIYVLKAITELPSDEIGENNILFSGINVRSPISSTKKVLLLSTANASGASGAVGTIKAELLASPTLITTVDVINAKLDPVPLALMNLYDAVIVTSNGNGGYSTERRKELGDSLAVYMASGKKVVLTGGLHKDQFTSSLSGAFETGNLSAYLNLLSGTENNLPYTSVVIPGLFALRGDKAEQPAVVLSGITSQLGAAFVSGLTLPFTGRSATLNLALSAGATSDVLYDDSTEFIAHKGNLIDLNAHIEDGYLLSGSASDRINLGALLKNIVNALVDGPVPVELSSFSASQLGTGVDLRWTTASEKNNLGFDVERSIGNGSFAKMEFIKGNGTTTEEKSYRYFDKSVPAGSVRYRLKQWDVDGKFEYLPVVELTVVPPKTYALGQNYPNPFNPATVITYQVPLAADITLKVYDLTGREVATLVNNERRGAGTYDVRFNAGKLTSGIYFYRLQAGNFVETKKMVLIK